MQSLLPNYAFKTFNKLAELKEDINRSTRADVTGEKIDLVKSFVDLETFIKARLSVLSNFDSELAEFNRAVNVMLAMNQEYKEKPSDRTEQLYREGMVSVMDALDQLQHVVIETRNPSILTK